MKPKKRRKRKNAAQEYYDTSDPFIDDSELAVDERTFFAQTKQQGFYVSSGQVALLTDKAPAKKPKSRASKKFILPPSVSISAALSNATLPPALSAPLSTSSSKLNSGNKMPISKVMNETNSSSAPPGPSKMAKSESSDGFGTKDSPIPLDDEAPTYITTSPTSGMKRKVSVDESFLASGSVASVDGENKKRKKTVQIKAFPPELEALIDELKDAIGKESWTVKGKFPQTLKPLLSRVALKAIVLNEYNDNFFNLMPKIFPYNRFTMTKLIKRTVWRDHTNILVERQNVLLGELKKLADDGFAKAQDEWERSVGMWERRQTVRTDGQDGLAPPTGGQAASAEGTPSLDDGADMDVDDALHPNGKQPSAKDAHPPAKRYRLTDQMKGIIWALVCLSNECCRIENEKNELENNHQIVSDQGVRKTLYQKIVACYPEGWLSSGQISREVSVMKKKYERDVMENAEGEP
ncbi:hypothetical protein PHLGIDRAFT_91452 [Phlebiopsis gigantea 11061_1 CR5-6]|uniref:Ubinuclein middle domain-containing protein n=1 Tax=Phlebiopsis gigantea (strain 11061_1 CR5-6) TaxID=745531 RepID=A0A0C3PIU6_PHLG1|nr:hypothetical protein PHLGIDRAFT_91452 [Phlebiopsis gigantea 11061_1 CR5-6]